MTENIARQPAGIPVGGQFASQNRSDCELELGLPAQLDAGTCFRHGGRFGDDATCSDCTDSDGEPCRDNLVDVYEYDYDYMSAAQLRKQLGLDVDSHIPEDIVRYTEVALEIPTEGEPVQLDVAELGFDDYYITLADAILSYDGESVIVVAQSYENLLWDDLFTEEGLDLAYPLVEEFFGEKFGAQITATDSWESAQVEFSATFAANEFSSVIVANQFGSRSNLTKFRNESDPGTFGSPYAYLELERRIKAATFVEDRWGSLTAARNIDASNVGGNIVPTEPESIALAAALAEPESELAFFAEQGWSRDRELLRAEATAALFGDDATKNRIAGNFLQWLSHEEYRREFIKESA